MIVSEASPSALHRPRANASGTILHDLLGEPIPSGRGQPPVASGVTSHQVVYKQHGHPPPPRRDSRTREKLVLYVLLFGAGYDGNLARGGRNTLHVCRSRAVWGPYLDRNGRNCRSGGGTTVLASHDNVYEPSEQSVSTDLT